MINEEDIQRILYGSGGASPAGSMTDFMGVARNFAKGATQRKAVPNAYAALASALGIDPGLLGALNSAGETDLVSELIGGKLSEAYFPDSSGGGGGSSGGSSSYQIGVDPAAQWNSEMEFGRDQAIATIIGEMVAKEYQRKGLQATQGAELLGMFQQALGTAAPSNLKSIPGFEPGGFAERLNTRMGGPADNQTIQAFRNPERATVPFQQVADILNSMKPVDEQMEAFRPLAEQLISEIQPVSNMVVGGSDSWSGSSGGGGGGISPGVFDMMEEVLAPADNRGKYSNFPGGAGTQSQIDELLKNSGKSLTSPRPAAARPSSGGNTSSTGVNRPSNPAQNRTTADRLRSLNLTAKEMDAANSAWRRESTGLRPSADTENKRINFITQWIQRQRNASKASKVHDR